MKEQPILQVISYGKLPEYDSFNDAIDAAKNKVKHEKSTDALKGKVIIDYLFDGYTLVLVFSSHEYLAIYAHSEGVKWELHSALPSMEKHISESALKINFPGDHNNTDRVYIWEWKKILDLLINKSISAACPGETMLSLYVKDVPDIIFSVVIVREDKTDRAFLFFDEE